MSPIETPPEADDDWYRERLYRVAEDDDLSLAATQERILELGADYLGVEHAHLARLKDDGEHQEVVARAGDERAIDIPVGAELDLATLYCRRTLEQGSPLALSDAPNQGWADDPAYETHGLACYLGATVLVDGERYGTVCFLSREARPSSFSASERAFVELVARVLGRDLETRAYESELAARDRRLAEREQALEASEAKYESLVTTAPDAIFLLNAETGVIAEVNDAAADLVGHSPEELVGAAVATLQPPAQRERYRGVFGWFLDGGGTRSRFDDGEQMRLRHRDGTDVPVEISASVLTVEGERLVQAIVRDISDRRDRRRELRLKDRAIDEAAIGITIADATADDTPLVYANSEFASLAGVDREDLPGRNCRFLQGEDTDPETVDRIGDAIAAEEQVEAELLNYREDGTPFWNELTIAPVEDSQGETTHFIGFQRDVTDRKRRERLLAVLNRVLRHNLRNEMTVVGGFADVLADETSGETAAMAQRIADTADRVTALGEKAQRLETVVRESERAASVDAAEAVQHAGERLRNAHPEATVTVDVADGAAVVTTPRLETAVWELCENAVRHAGPAPSVKLSVTELEGGTVRIAVSDDGPGLPETEREVLRSGRETPLTHGDGLGLWLVNWVVTGAGGRLSVAVDDGTTVTLDLPAADGAGTDRRSALGTEF
jgi:PAS domain S-box-containing protein